MRVYIIIVKGINDTIFVESVWETKALAKAAQAHIAKLSGRAIKEYTIISRELNQLREK